MHRRPDGRWALDSDPEQQTVSGLIISILLLLSPAVIVVIAKLVSGR